MKKYLLVVLALLLTIGVANAAGIPVGVDPVNFPEVWTQQVYNGTSSTIQSAVIVIWDYDTSTSLESSNYNDMCPWIKMPTEADDIWTAGVVPYGQTIASKTSGSIIIKGPAFVVTGASGTVNQLVGATATTGVTVDYAAGTDDCAVGRVIKANGITTGAGGGYTLVDVGVACSD